MEKKQRNILIAVVAGVCILGICVITGGIFLTNILMKNMNNITGTLYESYLDNFQADNNDLQERATITGLDQPYEHNGLKITATNVEVAASPDSSDQIIVGVRWIFENVSEEKRYVNDVNATAYINDIPVERTSNVFNLTEELFYGKLLPGKRTVGYYCVEVSRGAKQIELNYCDTSISKVDVTFILDIPPVEE